MTNLENHENVKMIPTVDAIGGRKLTCLHVFILSLSKIIIIIITIIKINQPQCPSATEVHVCFFVYPYILLISCNTSGYSMVDILDFWLMPVVALSLSLHYEDRLSNTSVSSLLFLSLSWRGCNAPVLNKANRQINSTRKLQIQPTCDCWKNIINSEL